LYPGGCVQWHLVDVTGIFQVWEHNGGVILAPNGGGYCGAQGWGAPDKWEHVAFIYDRAKNTVGFYVNGRLLTDGMAGPGAVPIDARTVHQMIAGSRNAVSD